MAKDTRVTFDSATPNNGSNNNNGGAMSPNGIGNGGGPGGGGGGGVGGGGMGGFGSIHTHHGGLLQQHHHHHSHHTGKPKRHSRLTERQVSTEDAENCINEISESFPALSTKAHRLMRQVSGSFNSPTLRVTLSLSILFNIIMCLTSGVFFGMWLSSRKSHERDGVAQSSMGPNAAAQGGLNANAHAPLGHSGNFHYPVYSRQNGGFFNDPSIHYPKDALHHPGVSDNNLSPFMSIVREIGSNPEVAQAICSLCPASDCAGGDRSPASTSGSSGHGYSGSSSYPSWDSRSSTTGGAGDIVWMDKCVPCGQLHSQKDVRVRTHNDMCCTSTTKQRVWPPDCTCVDSNEYQKALIQSLKSQIAAHMMMDVAKTKATNSPAWLTKDKDNASICFVGQGLEYVEGQLKIQQDGRYHVYSQLTFSTVDKNLDPDKTTLMVVFSIQRRRVLPSGRVKADTLLLSKITMENKREQNDSLGGAVKLKKDDIISVYISHPSYLKDRLEANYFGLYML